MRYIKETGGEARHHPSQAMTTTCCFVTPAAGFDKTDSFTVQIVGVDPDGKGVSHPSIESAFEYARQANGNGFNCFIHLA